MPSNSLEAERGRSLQKQCCAESVTQTSDFFTIRHPRFTLHGRLLAGLLFCLAQRADVFDDERAGTFVGEHFSEDAVG